MDTINIFLSVWKLLSVIQGLVCGGLVAAGILLSWMLRSNLHGETETEKEFAQQHKISYYQIDQGHKILFFWLIRGKILHICGGNILNISYNAALASLFERYAFFLFDTYAWSAHAPVQTRSSSSDMHPHSPAICISQQKKAGYLIKQGSQCSIAADIREILYLTNMQDFLRILVEE